MKNHKLRNTKGVSLPLITGLVSLLMVSSVAVNELIIRNMRSIHRIESGNRAYMAAEGGVEDALYELSPHFAGYQTPVLSDADARKIDFEEKNKCDPGDFCSKWTIESRSGLNTWNGKLYKNQKLILPIYYDNSDTKPAAQDVQVNEIYDYTFTQSDIKPLLAPNLQITFSIPDAASIIQSGGSLAINNDEDSELNEDPVGVPAVISCPDNPEDDDCDGQVDEDNDEDAVILWKLTNGGSLSLTPIKGCLEASLPASPSTDPCEGDFDQGFSPDPYSVTLDFSDIGINEKGLEEAIGTFIQRAINNPPNPANEYPKIQFELLIVAPMEHTDAMGKRYEIPYIEYEVSSASSEIPNPQFTIKSDGYYRGFKQSITSTVSPKTTVPLFDFTIIQQE